MLDPEDEAFEELALKQGHWVHTSGNRKRQIMEHEMNLPPKVLKAFPNAFWREDDGMDLRDYFASDAMKGLLSDPNWRIDADFEDTAYAAYMMADAMMKARVK